MGIIINMDLGMYGLVWIVMNCYVKINKCNVHNSMVHRSDWRMIVNHKVGG